MSGKLNAEHNICLAIRLPEFLHRRRQFPQPLRVVVEGPVFSQLDAAKIDGASDMSVLSIVGSNDQRVFLNSRNPLLLLLFQLILHLERLFRIWDLFLAERFQYIEWRFFAQSSNYFITGTAP
ncbi:hypothetical protein [Paenibacillus glucanolyticus]|uniref:hypothetical protein n=1 Tax=Paenibacillus glucanolyticus TaxID=59843 RepID=UPI001883B8DF|nr:hypothetical protein [Paenibacillus glucanolyticus]